MNSVLIAVTSVFFFFILFDVIPIDVVMAMILKEWDLGQMLGCLFLHGGLFHLIGNMLFLWIFGSAVCALVGNWQYGVLYLFLGIVASASHLTFSEGSAIGASGAINGVVGMSLVLFPVNKLNCIYFFSMPFMGIFWRFGKFTVKAYWMILLWLVYDILGAVFGGGNIGYWAHLGGFGGGMLVGYCLLLFNLVETYDPTLIEVLTGKAVERDTYDMDELAALASRKKKRENVLIEGDPVLDSLLQPDASLYPAEPVKELLPCLRVLRTATREKDVYVYFVNEGDTISNVALQCRDSISVEINPTTLASKSPGWMRLNNIEAGVLQDLSLSISYEWGEGKRTSKPLKYDGSVRKFQIAE